MATTAGTWHGRCVVAVIVAASALVGCDIHPANGEIGWHACGPSDGVDRASIGAVPAAVSRRLTCGRLDVALDPGDPVAGTVSLAVARLRARGPSRGVVVTDPGGPGRSGVQNLVGSATGLAADSAADRHDIVSLDPRGVGASRPTIRCRTDAERDSERAMDFGDRSPAGIARIERYRQELAQRCRERVGAAFLARVGTDFVVQDLDHVRAALDVDQISFVGHSYGTRIGIEYARRFPSRIRALVLDGVVDPAEDPIDAAVDQLAGFQHAFDAFAADCVGRPSCPLGQRTQNSVAVYRELLRPLITAPVRAGDRTLSAADAETGTVAALYRESTWSDLGAALTSLAAGDGSGLLRLADSSEGRDPDGHYDRMQDALLAIGCADEPRIPDRARHDEFDRRARVAAPFRDDARGTGRGPVGVCEFWTPAAQSPVPGGAPGTGRFPQEVPRILVVAGTGDPATPFATGARFASMVGAGFIRVLGDRHSAVFTGNRCVDTAVDDYLTDLTVPQLPLTC